MNNTEVSKVYQKWIFAGKAAIITFAQSSSVIWDIEIGRPIQLILVILCLNPETGPFQSHLFIFLLKNRRYLVKVVAFCLLVFHLDCNNEKWSFLWVSLQIGMSSSSIILCDLIYPSSAVLLLSPTFLHKSLSKNLNLILEERQVKNSIRFPYRGLWNLELIAGLLQSICSVLEDLATVRTSLSIQMNSAATWVFINLATSGFLNVLLCRW